MAKFRLKVNKDGTITVRGSRVAAGQMIKQVQLTSSKNIPLSLVMGEVADALFEPGPHDGTIRDRAGKRGTAQ